MISPRLAIAGAVVLALAAGGLALYRKGITDAEHQTEIDNANAATDAALAALGRSECRRAGGVWDFAAGKCRRAEGDGGD